MECLWSVLFGLHGNASDTARVIQVTGMNTRGAEWPLNARDHLVQPRAGYGVAICFELPCHSELRESISLRGPRRCPAPPL